MSSYKEFTHVCTRGLRTLFFLCLMPGVLIESVVAQEKPPAPAPDVVIFQNGDQLSGTLERSTGDSIFFKSDILGEVTIPFEKVKELRSKGSFVVLRKDEKITRTTRQPGTITVNDATVTEVRPSGAPESVPTKNLGFIVDNATYNKEVTGNPGIFQGWNGSITGGATILEATSYGQTLTAAITLIRAIPTVPYLPPRTRTTFDLLQTYGKLTQPTVPQTTPPTPDSVAKTNIFHTGFEHDKFLTPRFYALAGLSYDHNYSQGLNLGQIYGVGFGWIAVQTPVQELDLKTDVHYQRQDFKAPTPSEDLIGSMFGADYKRTLPARALFTASGTYLQSWNNFNAYTAIGAVGLALPVYHRFSLSMNLLNTYLNNPAIGYKRNSLQFVTGVTYTLH